MTTFLMIIGAAMIGLGVGLMSKPSDTKKPWKPKRKNWWFTDHKWNGPIGTPMI
jgi:hypothetical protein